MTKLESQFLDLKKALKRLKEACSLPETMIVRDATIQRFEFTFEMSWKILQEILKKSNIQTLSPKEKIRQAAKMGYITTPRDWIDFSNARNLTSHTYKEKIAKEVYKAAKKFVPEVEELIKRITNDIP